MRGWRPASGAAINLYREDYDRARSRGGEDRRATWRSRRRCARTTARPSRRRLSELLEPGARAPHRHRPRRPGDRRRGQPDGRVPGRARPRRPGQPVVRQAAGVGAGARDLHGPDRAGDRVRGGRASASAARCWRRRSKGVDPGSIPSDRGELEVGDKRFDAASFAAPGFLGERDRVAVLAPKAMESTAVRNGRLLAAGILAGFFVLAFTFALLVSRSLQRQIDAFLQAARRLGSGDFTVEVPTSGHDEFAALGEEFNKMSRQLEERLEELNQERARLQDAMRRIGETFAANLDRKGLLEIVVKTAVDGVGADAGRASVRPNASAPLEQVALTGSGRRARGGRARRRGEGARDRRAVRGDRRRRRRAVAPDAPRRRRPRARLGRGLGGAPRPRRSAPPSASSSTTWPSRRRCRSRTSACTRRSSARR